MKSVEDVVARIYKYERWRFGARNAEDAKQEIWLCVLEAQKTFDPSRGAEFAYLKYVAVMRLRRKLATARREQRTVISDDAEYADTSGGLGFRQSERNLEIRWMMRKVRKPSAIRAITTIALVSSGVLIDEAATAVYPKCATREVRRTRALEEVRKLGGAYVEWSSGESFAES
jgi:DNA-directed RNA polymerase specialized sigma24 family protein